MPAPLSSPSREDIDFFHENSYIQYPAFFTGEEIRTLRAAIDAAIAAKRERIRGAAKGGRHSEEYERVYIPDYVRFTPFWPESSAARRHYLPDFVPPSLANRNQPLSYLH